MSRTYLRLLSHCMRLAGNENGPCVCGTCYSKPLVSSARSNKGTSYPDFPRLLLSLLCLFQNLCSKKCEAPSHGVYALQSWRPGKSQRGMACLRRMTCRCYICYCIRFVRSQRIGSGELYLFCQACLNHVGRDSKPGISNPE